MLTDQLPSLKRKSDKLLPPNHPTLRLLRNRRLKPNLRRKCSGKEKDVNGLGVGSMANMVMDTSTVMVMVMAPDTDAADHTLRRKEVQDLDPATRRKSS